MNVFYWPACLSQVPFCQYQVPTCNPENVCFYGFSTYLASKRFMCEIGFFQKSFSCRCCVIIGYVGKMKENLVKIDFGQKFLKRLIFWLACGHFLPTSFWVHSRPRAEHLHFLLPITTVVFVMITAPAFFFTI